MTIKTKATANPLMCEPGSRSIVLNTNSIRSPDTAKIRTIEAK